MQLKCNTDLVEFHKIRERYKYQLPWPTTIISLPKIVWVKAKVSCIAINIRYLWIWVAHPSTLSLIRKNRNDWLPWLTTVQSNLCTSQLALSLVSAVVRNTVTKSKRQCPEKQLWTADTRRKRVSNEPEPCTSTRDWEPSFTSLFRPLRSGLWTGLATSSSLLLYVHKDCTDYY